MQRYQSIYEQASKQEIDKMLEAYLLEGLDYVEYDGVSYSGYDNLKNIADKAIADARKDCERFVQLLGDRMIKELLKVVSDYPLEMYESLGENFWVARNGLRHDDNTYGFHHHVFRHLAEPLNKIAKKFPTVEFMTDDGGIIYPVSW